MTHHHLAPDFAMDYGRNVVSLAAHRAPSKPLEPETASRRVRLELYFPLRITIHSAVPAGTQAKVSEQRLRDKARGIRQRHLDMLDRTPCETPARINTGTSPDYRKTNDRHEQEGAAYARNYTCYGNSKAIARNLDYMRRTAP